MSESGLLVLLIRDLEANATIGTVVLLPDQALVQVNFLGAKEQRHWTPEDWSLIRAELATPLPSPLPASSAIARLLLPGAPPGIGLILAS